MIYLKLLEKVMNSQGQWIYENVLPVREGELAFWLEEDENLVKMLVATLINMGLAIEITPDVLYFPESEEMTEKITDDALRKREYRKKKAEEKRALFNNIKQWDNVHGCPTEREEEEDKNREKERAMFNNIKQKDNVPALSQMTNNNTHPQVGLYGKLNNLILTAEEYEEICRTWEKPDELIDKVSCIVANMKSPPKNCYAYVHKVGISDGFEQADALKEEKKEKKKKMIQEQQQELSDREREEWYQEKMKEYGVCSKEEVQAIARQKFEEWKKNFGKN